MHVATEDYYMPMTTFEDGVDISYRNIGKAAMLSEAIGSTNVGQLRDRLDVQLNQCLLAELVESPGVSGPGGNDLAGVDAGLGEDMSESIFDYGSKMGQLPYDEGGCWVYDETTATWTRIIVVPRKEFYHPSEGLERSTMIGPVLSSPRDSRVTIPQREKIVKDNWRKVAMHESPTCTSEEWTGKFIFCENWAGASMPEEVNQVDRAGDLPGGLVFTNIPEYSLLDDLTGEPLP